MKNKLTVRAYYKHFIGIYGFITATVSAVPFISALVPADYSRYFFPPLGTGEGFSRIATLILAGLITIIVYFTKDNLFVCSKRGRTRVLSTIFTFALISLAIFFGLNLRFVRSIPIPSKGEKDEIVVSVGYRRTEFALTEFSHQSDWEMLRQRGVTEEQVFKLWTPGSIITARLALLSSYILFILSAIAVGSFAVLYDKCGEPSNP